jgi:hypothetical protein
MSNLMTERHGIPKGKGQVARGKENNFKSKEKISMKKIMMLLTATMLLFGLSGQSMASFGDGDLIQVVYSSAGTMETATDLGYIASLTTPATSNVTYNTNNFNIASLGSSATAANSYVAYFSYSPSYSGEGQVWTSGNSGGQTAKFGSTNYFVNGYNNTTGLYYNSATPGGSSAQVTVSMSGPNSYYTRMNYNGGAVGQMAGFLPNGDGEASLAALSTTGYVDQNLYYYQPTLTRGANASGLNVADVRTFADGSTEILAESGGSSGAITAPPPPPSPTPVPPSVLLMGAGLMCLLGIHRKMMSV